MNRKLKFTAGFFALLLLSFLLDIRPASAQTLSGQIRPAFVKFATQPTPSAPAYPDTCFNYAWWVTTSRPSPGRIQPTLMYWITEENCHTGAGINVYAQNAAMYIWWNGGTAFCGGSNEPTLHNWLEIWSITCTDLPDNSIVQLEFYYWAGSNTYQNPNWASGKSWPFVLTL